jgi:Ca2+-binding RTX toxin-like protein
MKIGNKTFALVVASILIGTVAVTWNTVYVYAANINCGPGTNSNPCLGTNQADNILGDNTNNMICGRDSSDKILLFADQGADQGYGNEGNDNINGGEGNDFIGGGEGPAPGCQGEGGLIY